MLKLFESLPRLKSGLYIVSTPIGNLMDMSIRGLQVLNQSDLIASEAPKTTLKLLSKFEILNKRLIQTKEDHPQIDKVLRQVSAGGIVSLVSEAGSPVISDPGSSIINTCHNEKLPLFVIPGPSAVVSSVAASGFNGDRFIFEGFLPKKRSKRIEHLQSLLPLIETRTLVFFESPDRILDCLQDAIQIFGPDRQACLCRELSKLFEEIKRDSLSNIFHHLSKPNSCRGEFTIVIKSNI